MYNREIKVDFNYILWSLIFIPISVGVFLIGQDFISSHFGGDQSANSAPPSEGKPFFAEPPEVVRAIYLTSTSAGREEKIGKLIELVRGSNLNSVVIDVKDFSGYVAYDSKIPDVNKYKTERLDIKNIDSLVKRLHENNIYIIARMTVFQDPALVRARPDWAVKNKFTQKPWQDRNGLSWIDPACRECWKYYSSIAKEAIDLGFDEINFDYIRFPTDGDMQAMAFPFWDQKTPRPKILNEFFKYMREELGDAKMSADLFGFVTTRTDDFGVGQVMEDAFEYFDYIAPMVYPSHYPNGFLKFANPAAHPYEVIHHTMKSARERLLAFKQKTGNNRPHIRPWLQDFNLGADYTEEMVRAQIKATQDGLGDQYNGFMLWNARNVYHEGVFR